MNHSRINRCRATFFPFASALLFLTSCGKQSDQQEGTTVFPDLPASVELQKGVYFQEATVTRNDVPMKVWIYLPEKAPKGKLPCVLIAPAGTPLIFGMALSEGDRMEHLPYVKAGFAVVSYELDGNIPNQQSATDAQIVAAANAFKNARAGQANAKAALDFALEKVPVIDPERIYTAGHSSAGTLALLVAGDDPRIKACVAYAPCTNVPRRLAQGIPSLTAQIPGFADYVKDSSPLTHAAKIKCPVFLFHARDDQNVMLSESQEYSNELKKTNSQVTFAVVNNGGHSESMIKQGIPQAIAWLKKLPK